MIVSCHGRKHVLTKEASHIEFVCMLKLVSLLMDFKDNTYSLLILGKITNVFVVLVIISDIMVQLCFACKERNPCFVFPANRRKDMFEWMNILGLEDVPGKNA